MRCEGKDDQVLSSHTLQSSYISDHVMTCEIPEQTCNYTKHIVMNFFLMTIGDENMFTLLYACVLALPRYIS